MQVITLYKYERPEGGTTISPIKPDVEYTECIRLIADEGKLLTLDGNDTYPCIDVDSIDGWYEIEDQMEKYMETTKIYE